MKAIFFGTGMEQERNKEWNRNGTGMEQGWNKDGTRMEQYQNVNMKFS